MKPTKKLICPCETCLPIRVENCPCKDCGVDTRRTDFYMVHTWLWDKYVPEDAGETFLCVLCLEKRIGRKLRKDDFGNFMTNSRKVQMSNAGPILKSRMGLVPHRSKSTTNRV
jgi:hypothetical protein